MRSINFKITGIIIVVTLSGVLTAVGSLFFFDIQKAKNDQVEQVRTQARLLSDFCVVPLDFGSPHRAREILSNLESMPHILTAILYDEQGAVFASYNKESSEDTKVAHHNVPFKTGYRFEDDLLHLVEPVNLDDQLYGTLYVIADTNFSGLVENYLLILSVIISVITLLSIMFAWFLQRIISRPIINLTNIIKKVSDNEDYTLQSKIKSHDEIGMLNEEFNKLLETIRLRQEQREHAEMMLADRESRYRSLTQNSEDLIFRLDREGHILFINQSAVDFFQTDPKAMKGLKLSDNPALPEKVREDIDRSCWQAIIQQRNLSREAVTFRNDKEVHLDLRYTPEYNDEGVITSILLIARDITHLKNTEKKLREAIKKAKESDQLKSAFLANMSHEIRTPINAIVGFSNLLNEPGIEDNERVQYLDIIRKRSNDLLQIISDIIDISKIEAGQFHLSMETFSVKNMIYDIYEAQKQKLLLDKDKEHNVQLKVFVDDTADDVVIRSSSTGLMQVFNNLINNALKFTEKGFVEWGFSLDEHERILFYVRDTGIGIPEDQRERVFSRFIQIEDYNTRSYGGTGLGLSICKGIVEHLGGEIWIEEPGDKQGGSMFKFMIPARRTKMYAKNDFHEKESPKLSGATILVVEDDPSTGQLIHAYLEDHYPIIKVVQDASEALAYLDAHHVDIALVDIQLPGMNGIDLAKIIKEKYPFVSLIAQTAHAMETDREACLNAGFGEYISKPFNRKELLDLLSGFSHISI